MVACELKVLQVALPAQILLLKEAVYYPCIMLSHQTNHRVVQVLLRKGSFDTGGRPNLRTQWHAMVTKFKWKQSC